MILFAAGLLVGVVLALWAVRSVHLYELEMRQDYGEID